MLVFTEVVTDKVIVAVFVVAEICVARVVTVKVIVIRDFIVAIRVVVTEQIASVYNVTSTSDVRLPVVCGNDAITIVAVLDVVLVVVI